MFEKSLYDLIRGLRNHKGNEREYIQHSLRECRAEIRGPDMDLKATALLKLIYLEMFGHDMSWASFNVLEVMSSQKYLQKRVGYLGAVQSFRTDTEVLMLATNLLKKDINSSSIPTISLPLITLPHIVTPSLAMSLLSDLMPRLSHSNPSIRKKTTVALYRLALVYPETLRPAWPKIKDMLMNEEEDASVIAAVINVVCELGWRRPRDFLPLAPRLFDLLIDGGNNWMAIKIIKLFATLTPLEPRLIKKLLPPLMTLIRTTQAMSLLYECINGIIQGGILEGAASAHESEEVAEICVAKLRGMIASEGDPNLKYVALLAFNKIVISHPHVVAAHQETILGCIDDQDVSIRLQALDLGSGMINSDNLMSVVNRLMKQLRNTQPMHSYVLDQMHRTSDIELTADSDGEDPEEVLRPAEPGRDSMLPMPEEYRITLIHRILDMCSRDTYINITDFEWYIQTLVELTTLVPSSTRSILNDSTSSKTSQLREEDNSEISRAIGAELRNVAVRVSAVREDVVVASNSLVTTEGKGSLSSKLGKSGHGVLQYAAWIVGEFSGNLISPHDTLNSLLLPTLHTLDSEIICAYLQAIPKVLIAIFKLDRTSWNIDFQTMISLLLARVVYFLEPFTTHPNLEVQERSVEFLELMRLATEAVKNHEQEDAIGPLLLTEAMPALFNRMELNPVAPTAQRKVPIPIGLELDIPINSELSLLLRRVGQDSFADVDSTDIEQLYYQRPTNRGTLELMPDIQANFDKDSSSYQNNADASIESSNVFGKRKQRQEGDQHDPFYIANPEESSSGATTPFQDIIRRSNGHDVDIDSIPIMDLDLGDKFHRKVFTNSETNQRKKKRRQDIRVTADENIDYGGRGAEKDVPLPINKAQNKEGANFGKGKKSLLEVDSSGIGNFDLEESEGSERIGIPGREMEDAEMAKALIEVERLRLEMQRASERISVAGGIPIDGTLVKKKKKKKQKVSEKPDPQEDGKEGADAQAYPSRPDRSGKRKKRNTTVDQKAVKT